MMKKVIQFGLLTALMGTLCAAQQSSVQREGNTWTSVVTGSLSGVRNLHIKVEIGNVKVQGGQSQGINYAIRGRSFVSPDDVQVMIVPALAHRFQVPRSGAGGEGRQVCRRAHQTRGREKGGQAEIGRQGQEEVMISSQSWIR